MDDYIKLDTGTVFYKKVKMINANGMTIGFAVLSLVSTGGGMLPKYESHDLQLNCLCKCRFNGAMVLRLCSYKENCSDRYIHYSKPPPDCAFFVSLVDKNFKYTIGEVVLPDSFNYETVACSNGIHGFLSYSSAERYA